jgi:DNA-binding transcriptional LysR family regulator
MQTEGLRIAMTVASSIEVHELVQSAQVDLGVIHPLTSAEGMLAAPAFEMCSVLALPPRHRLARRRKVDLRELDGEPQVVLGRQYRLRDLVEDAFAQHGATPMVVAETQSAAAACEMVSEGLGFTIVDAVTAGSYTGRLALAELSPRVGIPVQVLAPPGRPTSAVTARFLDLLLAEFHAFT